MSVEARFLVTSLVLIGGLLFAYYLMKRISSKEGFGPFGEGIIKVLARYPVGAGSSLMVVKVLDMILVLGVTAHEIRVLYEIGDKERVKEIEDLAYKQGKFLVKGSLFRREKAQ